MKRRFLINAALLLFVLCGITALSSGCDWTSPASTKGTAAETESSQAVFTWQAKNGDRWQLVSTQTQEMWYELADGSKEPLTKLKSWLVAEVEILKIDAERQPIQLRISVSKNFSQPFTWQDDPSTGDWRATTNIIERTPSEGGFLDVEWDAQRGHWTTLEPGVDQHEWLNATGVLKKRLLARNLRPEIPQNTIEVGEEYPAASKSWRSVVASNFGKDGDYQNFIALEELPQERNGVHYRVLKYRETMTGSPPKDAGFQAGSTLSGEGSGEIQVSEAGRFQYSLTIRQHITAQGEWLPPAAPLDALPQERRMITKMTLQESFTPAEPQAKGQQDG